LAGDGGGVRVKVGVQVGNGVGESNEGVVKTEGVVKAKDVNNCRVGEEVGIKVGVAVGTEVEVAMLFPSTSESEKPPRSKPIEARATTIPKNTCRKFFIANSLQATLSRPASGH